MRADSIKQLAETPEWDVVVIGGGATGLGTAVDAAARGYKTLLLEEYDFGKGTSSRSTKLVHGGVRYLAQGNISLVREALHERGLLFRNAPHLTRSLPFVIPAYHWWELPFYGIGLLMYDLLAGRLGIGATRLVSRAEALRRVPTLKPRGLHGGIVYFDGQFDDARLAISLVRTLFDLGGTAINYTPVTGLLKREGCVAGVRALDKETGRELTIPARGVVNATGVYVDALRRMDDPVSKPMLAPSQGTHLVLDRSFLPGDNAIMVPHTEDNRVLFIIPWLGCAIVGTTDIPVDRTPIEPRALEQEIEYLISHAAHYLTKEPRREDVLSIYSGLRPLVRSGEGKNTAQLSRDHVVQVSQSGLVTVTGGKWTTYRRIGEDTVNQLVPVAALENKPSRTATLKLHGWQSPTAEERFAAYGSDAAALVDLLAEQAGWGQPLHPELPYCGGEVIWAARYELARTVEDVLARRTRALLLNARASQEVAPRVAELLAHELGMPPDWQQQQASDYILLANGYLLNGGDSDGRPQNSERAMVHAS